MCVADNPLLFPSSSDQRRYSPNGPLHLPHHRCPARSGGSLHLLQTSPQQHAEEILVITNTYSLCGRG